MRRFTGFIAVMFITILMAGCGSMQGPPPTPIDTSNAITKSEAKIEGKASVNDPVGISNFVVGDLTNAAALATANGFPARAAVYTGLATQLQACQAAVAAWKGSISAPSGPDVGVFTLAEAAAEAVAQGIPINVKVNCEPITIPSL